MNQGAKLGIAGFLGILAGAGATVVATSSVTGQAPSVVGGMDRSAIEKIVREYILTHPEILPEAMRNLERKEAAAKLKQQGDGLEVAFGSAWEGAADADVTLVEFFDYACGYCKLARPDVERLLKEDPKLRVVYRDLPILGKPSDDAARVSLALAKTGGNYGAFHASMYKSGHPSPEAVNAALVASGADANTVRAAAKSPEIDAEIKRNLGMQASLGLSGTPSWIIGDQMIGGAVGYDELKAAIAEVRAAKSKA